MHIYYLLVESRQDFAQFTGEFVGIGLQGIGDLFGFLGFLDLEDLLELLVEGVENSSGLGSQVFEVVTFFTTGFSGDLSKNKPTLTLNPKYPSMYGN